MDVTLKEHLESLIRENDRRYEQRFNALAIALDKADEVNREYKVGSNEWRDAMKDTNNRMATREELAKLDAAVRELQRARANLDGRLVVLSGSVSIVVSVLLWVFVK